jgi:hypothetical protein
MTQILDIAQVGVAVPDRSRWEEFARDVLGFPTFRAADEFGYGHRRVNDAMHQPVIYPAGTPVDIWGGDIQSPEFILG